MFEPAAKGFGLDISDNSVRATFVTSKGKINILHSVADLQLPDGIVKDGQVYRAKTLAEAIKNLLANAKPKKITLNSVVCSLPESKVYSKIVEMPKMSKDKLAGAIQWEVESYIPMNVEQVYYDWEVIRTHGGKARVLIAAAPKKIVDPYIKALELAGLNILALEMESRSIVRALIDPQALKKETVLLVDIGDRSTNLTVFDDDSVHYTSHITTAGGQFTKTIERKLELTTSKAEAIKKKNGLDPKRGKGVVLEALREPIDEIATEISNTINFYHDQSESNGKISRVLLAGGSANMRGLSEYIQGFVDVKVQVGDSKNNTSLALGNKVDKIITKEKSITYATSLGLGIRGAQKDPVSKEINLTPQEWQIDFEERGIKKFYNFVTYVIIFFCLLAVVGFAGVWLYLDRFNSNLEESIRHEEDLLKIVDPEDLRGMAMELNEQLDIISSVQASKENWSQLFDTLNEHKPEGITFKDFETKKGGSNVQVIVKGVARDRTEILQYQKSLEMSKFTSSVDLPLSSLGAKENISFELSIVFKGEILKSNEE